MLSPRAVGVHLEENVEYDMGMRDERWTKTRSDMLRTVVEKETHVPSTQTRSNMLLISTLAALRCSVGDEGCRAGGRQRDSQSS